MILIRSDRIIVLLIRLGCKQRIIDITATITRADFLPADAFFKMLKQNKAAKTVTDRGQFVHGEQNHTVWFALKRSNLKADRKKERTAPKIPESLILSVI